VQFRRGDVNVDGRVDISDAIASLIFQFRGNFDAPCREALDFENEGQVEITDTIASLAYQFRSGPPPSAPFPDYGKVREFDLFDFNCERYDVCPPMRDTHEVVRIEPSGDEVEIEVFSTRPFLPRALAPILCIGTQAFTRSGSLQNGSLNSLLFTLTREEFEAVQDPALITVQHGDQCFLDLDQPTLYWDLWVFGVVTIATP